MVLGLQIGLAFYPKVFIFLSRFSSTDKCVCVCVFTSCDLKISINNLKIFKPNLYSIRFAHSSTWSTCNRLHVWEGCLLCWHVLQKCKLLLCFSWFQGWCAAFVWGCSLFCKNIIVIWKDILLGWNTFISLTVYKNVLHFINGKMYALDYHSRTDGSPWTTIWIFTLFLFYIEAQHSNRSLDLYISNLYVFPLSRNVSYFWLSWSILPRLVFWE